MEEREGTGFFVARVPLFNGSGTLVDLVVAGGGFGTWGWWGGRGSFCSVWVRRGS
jgi:hypothetical protein